MGIINTEEMINKLDMFQSRFEKNRRIWLVGFGKNFSRCRYALYLHGIPVQISNLQCLYNSISSLASGNEQKSQSDMENVAYDFTLTYGTYKSSGRLYPFYIHIYR